MRIYLDLGVEDLVQRFIGWVIRDDNYNPVFKRLIPP